MLLRIVMAALFVANGVFVADTLNAQHPPQIDAHGDPLPPGAVARLGTGRFLHSCRVTSLVFSPDCTRLASLGQDGVRIWELPTGKPLQWLRKNCNAVAFHPDGRMLASGNSNSIFIWNTSNGKLEREIFDNRGGTVTSLSFSVDGKQLARGDSLGHGPGVYDPQTGKARQFYQDEPPPPTRQVEFSPDGRFLAKQGGNDVWMLSTVTGKYIHVGLSCWAVPQAIAFSTDSRFLAGLNKNGIKVWDLRSGRIVREIDIEASMIVFASAHSLWAAYVGSDKLENWDVRSGKRIQKVRLPHFGIECLAASKDGRLLAVGAGENVWLCGLQENNEVQPLNRPTRIGLSVAFFPDGRTVAAGGYSSGVALWDIGRATITKKIWHSEPIRAMALSRDGRWLAGSIRGGDVRIFDFNSERTVHNLAGHKGWVSRLLFTPDNKTLISATNEGDIRVWDTQHGKQLAALPPQEKWITDMAISADGKSLVSGGDRSIRLVDLPTRAIIKEFMPDLRQKGSMAMDDGGQWLATLDMFDSSLILINLRTFFAYQQRGKFHGPLVFFKDGRRLLNHAGDGTVRVHDLITGEQLHRFAGHQGVITSFALSADECTIVSASNDGTALVWPLPAK